MASECLWDVHREVRGLFDAAGCRTAEERQALAEQLVGPGPVTLAQAAGLMERLREALDEPHDEVPRPVSSE